MKTIRGDKRATTRGKGGKRQRTPLEIEVAIRGYARDNFTPIQIYRLMKDNEKLLKGHKLPDLRTVQRIHRKAMPPDTTGPWSLADADPDHAALILPVLAEAIEHSGGRWQRFSKDLAGWIAKVRVAAPDLPVSWALNVAQAYRAAKEESDTEELEGLDQMLAFAPWRDEDHHRRYLQAFNMLHPEGWFLHFGIAENSGSEFAPNYCSPGAQGVMIASTGWSRQKPPRVLELEAAMRLIEERDSDEEAPHD